MIALPNWRTSLWLLLSTVLAPAVLAISVGILILVFYRAPWDVAFGVLVLCFAVFAVTGSSITVFLLRRTARLAQLQADFIANISHDFRTPLTSIRMFVETLRAGRVQDPEEQARCLELLERETRRMERLVQRVLAFRQLDEPGRAMALKNAAPHDAVALLERALEPFSMNGRDRAIERVVEPALPQVYADEDAVVEALRALVDNALKYSQNPGPVVLTLRADGKGVAISVRDQGPPIPRRERKRVFRRFYRVPGNGEQGSGIGLAAARQVARNHGGSLVLSASHQAGNVFTLQLPAAGPPSEMDSAEAER